MNRSDLSTPRFRAWLMLRALGPCTDKVLERAMKREYGTPDSSVRGARNWLVKHGMGKCVGRTKGRRPRRLWQA